MSKPVITFYTKPNCSLCDKALEQIEWARREVEFELLEINILGDLELYERYKYEIPVVLLNGQELFRHRLTCAALLEKLRSTPPAKGTA